MNSHKHNKHVHPGRTSSIFFTSDEVLNRIGIENETTFLDAGCGDGFISIAASKLVGDYGRVYAVDIDGNSIKMLNKEIEQNNIINIKAIQADISKNIPINGRIIDNCVMVNVLHGLVDNEESDAALKEIKRVAKTGGTFTIIEFKKVDSFPGPPKSIRLEPEQMESILLKHDFEKVDYFEIGKSHYGIIFSFT
jgi:ubiquinone/menaquinone biosynthesis C-methylase UbiE